MSKLVAVKRMNKHGVMVTKHVREDSVDTSVEKKFPRATAATEPEKTTKAMARIVANHVATTMINALREPEEVNGKRFEEHCASHFMTLSPDTLRAIDEYSLESDNFSGPWVEYEYLSALASVGGNDQDFVNAMAVMDHLFNGHEMVGETGQMIPLVLPLKLYDRYILSHNNKREMSIDERLPYYKALIDITCAMEEVGPSDNESPEEEPEGEFDYDGEGYSPSILYCHLAKYDVEDMPDSPVIEDQQMIELVVKHVDRVLEIEDFIMERENRDSNLLREYLEGTPRALSEGVL